MKVSELRQMSAKDLWKLLRETRRKLATVRFHVKTGQEQNTAEIGKLKKAIARILTILHNEKK